TFAHPAIVLSFKYFPKRWFSKTGLVIGSMAPDFEYFIRLRVKAGLGFILLIVLTLPQGNRIKVSHITRYWIEVIIVSIIVLLIRILTGLSFNEYGNLVVTLITGCLLGLIIASLLTNKKEKYN
ncbi:MAG TPA: DUF4184 family protein, partial [Mucilaginibacter sp.]|nr:DUF4184 family protein [Mucilaginibacter sp.]